MPTSLDVTRSRRAFLSGVSVAAAFAPFPATALPGWRGLFQKSSERLPFNPDGPLDVRLRPLDGHTDYWRQTALMQAFDRFGRHKFHRDADAYAQRVEIHRRAGDAPRHRVTWKFATEEMRDGFDRRLRSILFPYSKGFSHESPVTGGVWELEMDLRSLPHTVEAFAFLQQPFDIQYIYYLLSERWTGIEKLHSIGDTVTAGVEPQKLGDNWFTRPTWEFYLDPAVRYWSGQYRLTLTLAGLTKVAGEWCARLDFDCIVPERLALRTGSAIETRHLHAHTIGDIEVSLADKQMVRCFWNHFIMDGDEEVPDKAGMVDAAPGVRFWRRQILLKRVGKEEFDQATPTIKENEP